MRTPAKINENWSCDKWRIEWNVVCVVLQIKWVWCAPLLLLKIQNNKDNWSWRWLSALILLHLTDGLLWGSCCCALKQGSKLNIFGKHPAEEINDFLQIQCVVISLRWGYLRWGCSIWGNIIIPLLSPPCLLLQFLCDKSELIPPMAVNYVRKSHSLIQTHIETRLNSLISYPSYPSSVLRLCFTWKSLLSLKTSQFSWFCTEEQEAWKYKHILSHNW